MGEVKLSSIRKTYKGGLEVVKGINCTIKDKEFVVLVGPSGCGKSTTLRMIAGLEEISDGELFIGEKKVNDIPASERGIAMVFQNYALYPHMNAYENMAFGLKIQKLPKNEIKERVMNAAEILSIEPLLYKKPSKMSGGQRQRVAIGRAIVRRPKVFLFDEPLSNLDAKLRSKMRIELAKLHKKLNTTMIYVTHDQVEAMTLGERIMVMREGHIMQMDDPIELFNNPHNKFVAEFIGTPQMNFINGVLHMDGKSRVFKNQKRISFDLSNLDHSTFNLYNKKEISLGIRSENIRYEKGDLNNTARLTGKVIAVEILGNHKLVHIEYEDFELVAKFRTEVTVTLNNPIDIYLDIDKAYFFDNVSGDRIY